MIPVNQYILNYFDQMVAIRRHLHQNPELSGEEVQTAHYIGTILDQIGIPYTPHIAGHGIVATIKGELEGDTCIALRADMDALPVKELNNVSYCSQNEGVMHACGHDFHTASLLGALMVLQEHKSQFGGTVKAIFQPSEERYEGGAHFMIEAGVLENPKVDYVFALHADTGFGPEKVGFRAGKYMASTDEIHFTIIGKGGHAALLNDVINPIPIAARLLIRWEEEIEKLKPTDTPYVLNFGRFIGDGANNVIPDSVTLSGTLRVFDEEKRAQILAKIEEIAHDVCHQYGATCIPDIRHGYPMLKNDPQVTKKTIQIAQQVLGEENVLSLDLRTTAEDFSYFLQQVPGTFFRVGVANPEQGIVYPLHSAHFNIDERALKTASKMMVAVVFEFFK
ncbi:MAG: N-acyl-L-amino acid amidohydrolase [Bacteroidetes bacterium]|nr:N-acyl-L-amino acid amidohydrolase [Bacteroidota bacterium]